MLGGVVVGSRGIHQEGSACIPAKASRGSLQDSRGQRPHPLPTQAGRPFLDCHLRFLHPHLFSLIIDRCTQASPKQGNDCAPFPQSFPRLLLHTPCTPPPIHSTTYISYIQLHHFLKKNTSQHLHCMLAPIDRTPLVYAGVGQGIGQASLLHPPGIDVWACRLIGGEHRPPQTPRLYRWGPSADR